jgi:Mn2+/Fe2+ NRAMP family transporter
MPRLLAALAVWGPGLLVMLADTDAGNIVTAAQAGARWGYRLLPLPLLLIPLLVMVQELTARLALVTGQGFGTLVRSRCGRPWAWLAGAALAVATAGSLVTEFDGVAGVGELYGVPRWVALLLAATGLLAVVLGGAYRRVERVAIVVGLFGMVFFAVAWRAHPQAAAVLHETWDQRLGDPGYRFLGAALIGATFNPWMLFYQPSALVAKRLGPAHLRSARWDTAVGAVLTQGVTAAVLVAVAATLGRGGGQRFGLESVGGISAALTPFLGAATGRPVFGFGVIGAAMVAAVVCSLALAWGLRELAGWGRGNGFTVVYVAGVAGSAAIVLAVPDLVWLSVSAQVLNALLMPVLLALLLVLATGLPPEARLRGWYLWLVSAVCTLVCAAGLAAVAL